MLTGPVNDEAWIGEGHIGTSLLNYWILIHPGEGQILSSVVYPLVSHQASVDNFKPIVTHMTLIILSGSLKINKQTQNRTHEGKKRTRREEGALARLKDTRGLGLGNTRGWG